MKSLPDLDVFLDGLKLDAIRSHQFAELYRSYAKVSSGAQSDDSDQHLYYQKFVLAAYGLLDSAQEIRFRTILDGKIPVDEPDKKKKEFAEEGEPEKPLSDPSILDKCLRRVELDDYQKQEISDIKKEFRETKKSIGDSIGEDEERALEERMLDEVLFVLDDDQKDQLRKAYKSGDERKMLRDTDPRRLCYAVMRLNRTRHHITRKQMSLVQQIRKRYMQMLKRLPKNDFDGQYNLNLQFGQRILDVLTPEQQEAMDGVFTNETQKR